MKPSRIFLSSRFSTAPHLFRFLAIQQLVVHDTSPPRVKNSFLSRISSKLQLLTLCLVKKGASYESS
jgi:hypothetical protein